MAAQIATEAAHEGSTASLVGLLALRPLSGVEHPAGGEGPSRTHSQEVNQMLGLRFWCNLLAHAPAAQVRVRVSPNPNPNPSPSPNPSPNPNPNAAQLAALVPAALEAATQATYP